MPPWPPAVPPRASGPRWPRTSPSGRGGRGSLGGRRLDLLDEPGQAVAARDLEAGERVGVLTGGKPRQLGRRAPVTGALELRARRLVVMPARVADVHDV